MFLTNINDLNKQKLVLLQTLENISHNKKPSINDFFEELVKLDVAKKGEEKNPKKDRGRDYMDYVVDAPLFKKAQEKELWGFLGEVQYHPKKEPLEADLYTVVRAMMKVDHPDAKNAAIYLFDNASADVRGNKMLTILGIVDRGLIWDQTPYRDFYFEVSNKHTPLGAQLYSNVRKILKKVKPVEEGYKERYYNLYRTIQRSPDTITGVLNVVDEIELLEEND